MAPFLVETWFMFGDGVLSLFRFTRGYKGLHTVDGQNPA